MATPKFHIIDTNHNTTSKLSALKSAGVDTLIRYVAAGLVGREKVIKPAEARAIAEHGMKLGTVYEIAGRPSGTAIGRRDGEFTADYLPTVGVIDGCATWYTVDYDADSSDYPGIASACRAFKKALEGRYKMGIYSSGYIADRLVEDGILDSIGGQPLIWLTDSLGFRGTRASIAGGRYVMIQGLPRITTSLDTDPNWINNKLADSKIDYIGVCIPRVPDAQDVEGSIAWVQKMLNDIDEADLEVDGINGPFTIRAVEKFQESHGLVVDGIVGPITRAALKKAASESLRSA
jgi:peptidoglycan hydrolase-like protein with peptidoglycan-binding domain